MPSSSRFRPVALEASLTGDILDGKDPRMSIMLFSKTAPTTTSQPCYLVKQVVKFMTSLTPTHFSIFK